MLVGMFLFAGICWGAVPVTDNLIAAFDGTSANLTPSGKIMTWYDQAANGGNNNAIGETPAPESPDSRPLMVDEIMPNGLIMPVVRFDGTNDNLTVGSTSALDTNQLTWFIVVKADDTSVTANILRSGYSDRGDGTANPYLWGSYTYADSIYSHARSIAGSNKARGAAANSNQWYVVTGSWNGDSIRQWLDGVYSGGLAGADALPSGHIRTRIGASSTDTPDSFFAGYVAEILIYDTAMGIDDSDRELIETYLTDKYITPQGQLSVPITHDMIMHFQPDSAVTTYDAGDDAYYVDSWTDLSGHGNDAVMFDSASRPRLVSDGDFDSLDFDSGDGLESNFKALVVNSNDTDFVKNRFTWFIVYKDKQPSSAGWRSLLSSGYEFFYTYFNYVWGSRTANNTVMSFTRTRIGEWRGEVSDEGEGVYGWNAVVGLWDPNQVMDGDIDQYVNPVSESAPTLADAKSTVPDGLSDIVGDQAIEDNPDYFSTPIHRGSVIGAVFETDQFGFTGNLEDGHRFGGNIAEIIVYNTGLTPVEILSVSNYLEMKYGYGGQQVALEPLTDCFGIQASGESWLVDMNEDCEVNFGDLGLFATEWLSVQ